VRGEPDPDRHQTAVRKWDRPQDLQRHQTPGLAEDVSESLQYRGFKVQPVDAEEDNRASIDS
jgi:hypothetical protein